MTAVIDASALVEAVLRRPAGRAVVLALVPGPAFAPEMLDAEVMSTLARLERRGKISTEEAQRALRMLARAPVDRLPHLGLLERAWQRRHNVSAYDAFYVALAARLDCPLVTADRRLAAAPGLDITVTLVQG